MRLFLLLIFKIQLAQNKKPSKGLKGVGARKSGEIRAPRLKLHSSNEGPRLHLGGFGLRVGLGKAATSRAATLGGERAEHPAEVAGRADIQDQLSLRLCGVLYANAKLLARVGVAGRLGVVKQICQVLKQSFVLDFADAYFPRRLTFLAKPDTTLQNCH